MRAKERRIELHDLSTYDKHNQVNKNGEDGEEKKANCKMNGKKIERTTKNRIKNDLQYVAIGDSNGESLYTLHYLTLSPSLSRVLVICISS